MKQVSRWTDRLTAVCLPLSFLGPGFLNALTYPLGLHSHDTARTLTVFGILGASALFLLFRVLALFVKTPDLRGPLLASLLVPAVFGLVYLLALAGPADRALVLRSAVVQGYYLAAAWSALVLIAAEKRLRSFLRSCRACAWVLSPILLFYCVRFYIPSVCEQMEKANQRVVYLGSLDYMSLAYTLLPLCLFLMMEAFLYAEDGHEKDGRALWVQDTALFTLFSITIALSGTKGAILCLALAVCLLALYAHLIKCRRRVGRTFLLLALLPLLLFSTALYPQSLGESRSVAFIKELFSQSPDALDSALDDASGVVGETAARDFASVVLLADSPAPGTDGAPEEAPLPSLSDIFAVDEYVSSGQINADLASGRITREEADAYMRVYDIMANTSVGIRMYLLRHAVQEIRAAPLTGQGVFFFQTKYGTYPHNFLLELATDFGLPITLLVLALGLYVFARLIRASMENAVVGMLLLYVFSYLPQLLVSGTLYSYSPFFQYGFCVLLAFYFIPRVKRRDPALWEDGAPSRLPLKN